MILIVDYGIGNLRSLEKAFQAVGVEATRSGDPAMVSRAERLVVPGVGAFGACAAELKARGLWEPVRSAAASGVPLLGVCVGMQLLFEGSDEHGAHEGLALLPGKVARFPASDPAGERLKVPHMGWNVVHFTREHPLARGLAEEAHFYFVHSYRTEGASPEDVLGVTEYGSPFPAVVARNNILGVQFHPEKSQAAGLRVLRNFADLHAPARVD